MDSSAELLALRLGMLGILFLFLLVVSAVLRAGVAPRRSATPARAVSRAGLVVLAPALTGLPVGAEFELIGETSLGRDAANGIVLADPSVSGRHALLARTERGWTARDLGSTNGTEVSGRPSSGRPVFLRDGDQLTVGSVRFRFYA